MLFQFLMRILRLQCVLFCGLQYFLRLHILQFL